MPNLLDLLPCDRVPIYDCINGSCNKCYSKLKNELNLKQAKPLEVKLNGNIESINQKTLVSTI